MRIRLALVALAMLLGACGSMPPVRILSYYGDMNGVNNLPRSGPHPAIDIDGGYGDPVLAAADGTVAYTYPNVGKVVIRHLGHEYHTVYLHMSEVYVLHGHEVRRGQMIGRIGTAGRSGGVPHVHFEVCGTFCTNGHNDGDMRGTTDPLTLIVGCFDPDAQDTYAALAAAGSGIRRLILTYPVACRSKKR